MFEKDWVDNSNYKNIKKGRNKIVEILAKSKYSNLLKSKSENLSRFKKISGTSAIKKT